MCTILQGHTAPVAEPTAAIERGHRLKTKAAPQMCPYQELQNDEVSVLAQDEFGPRNCEAPNGWAAPRATVTFQ